MQIAKLKQLEEAIHLEKNFIVSSHIHPDGDNLGSVLAMLLFLKKLGKNAVALLEDDIPEYLSFLPSYLDIVTDADAISEMISQDYTIIALDCANVARLALPKELLPNARAVINIDHHRGNENFGSLNLIDSAISSTCELVADLLTERDESFIDADIATCLLAGILTDTNRFLYESVTSVTLKKAADLIEKGAEKDMLMDRLYRSGSYSFMRFLATCLSRIEVCNEISFLMIPTELFIEYALSPADVDELIPYVINLAGIEIGIVAKEITKNRFKLSLRSKGEFDVNRLAAQFGGGGHRNASGCYIEGEWEDCKKRLLKVIEGQRNDARIH